MLLGSGNSEVGRQILLTGSTPNPTIYSVRVGTVGTPPSFRVGYFFLYAVDSTNPSRYFVIDQGALHTPGIYRKANPVPPLGGSFYQLEVVWNRAGIPYVAGLL